MSGSWRMRRLALAAAAVLLALAFLPARALGGKLPKKQGPTRLIPRADKFLPKPVEDAPQDGCINIRHRIPLQDGEDYRTHAGVCGMWGQEYINQTERSDGNSFGNLTEVMCSQCGLKDHKLLRHPFYYDSTTFVTALDCAPGWIPLANTTFMIQPDGSVEAWGPVCATYRPACLECKYEWFGDAPFCNPDLLVGSTLIAKSYYGDGAKCIVVTDKPKFLVETCSGGNPYNLASPQCNTTCSDEPRCTSVGETALSGGTLDGQCRDIGEDGRRCMTCPLKPRNQMCSGNLLGGGTARCGGKVTGMRWTDKPSTMAKGVKSGSACCAACLRDARCRRYQFSAAARVGCQLFYSQAPAGQQLTKKARGYVRGQKIGQ